MTTVEKIHAEIDTAQDRLLAHAYEILNKMPSDKIKRLSKIGFHGIDAIKKYRVTNEQAELIEYYKQNYPFQKFITEKEMDRICKKYNLIYAPIGRYKNDVPEKNITDIEVVSELKREDYAKNEFKTRLKLECWPFPTGGSFLSIWSTLFWTLPRVIDGEYDFFSRADAAIKQQFPKASKYDYVVRSCRPFEINRQGLFIAAPKSHFDLKGLSNQTERGFFNITLIEPKDPIVFRYVKGGIQVITKWGEEANDEALVNEIEN